MAGIVGSIMDFRRLDLLATGDSVIHRLDGRTKVLATLAFVVSVASFDRYSVSALLPFAVFPTVLLVLADLPAGFILKKALLVSLIAVAIGIFNPLLDRQILLAVDGAGISGGWISFVSIVLRSLLTVSAALILAATTGFPAICRALGRFGVPQVLVRQLQFMHRYLFVLAEEAQRMARARELRSCRHRGMGRVPFASLVGHLLLRTWERADRVHLAMLCRGGSGQDVVRPSQGFGRPDILFLLGWVILFLLFKLYNVPRLLGDLII